MQTYWTAKIALKNGKSWLHAHTIGYTRREAKINYTNSGRTSTDEMYGSKVTFVKVQLQELTNERM